MPLSLRIRIPRVALDAALEGLTGINAVILDELRREGHELPDPYEWGVRYQREPRGRSVEEWHTVLELLRTGHGDCEDLAAAVAAWYRVYEAEPARALVARVGPRQYHAVVERADGEIEDPSRILLDAQLDTVDDVDAWGF